MKIQRSGHEEINKGYFYGLPEEIHRRTKISRPIIAKALKSGKGETAKQNTVIRVALQIIAEQ